MTLDARVEYYISVYHVRNVPRKEDFVKKWLKPTVFICTLTIVICAICGLAACEIREGEGVVTQIQLENTEIHIGESGDANSYQLQPIIVPANAADKSVSYRIMDGADREFVLLSPNGTVTALKAKPEGTVTVRIYSNQRPSVYLDVRIYVESQEVGVKKIEFDPQEIQLKLTDDPYLAEPIFTPYYAVQGRTVTWSSLNEDYATVDPTTGLITPKAPGVTYIVATSQVAGVSDDDAVQGRLKVTVTYADLSYRINMENDGPAVMRQIVGSAEEIRLNLLQMDELCDPNPQIRWYVNNDRITESEGKREFRYTPSVLPYGEYTIRAEVSNNLQKLILYYDTKLKMYEPLSGFDVNVLNETDKLQAGDVLLLQAGLPERAYAPESFAWYVRLKGEQKETFIQTTDTPELNYKLTREGEYTFRAVAIIKGVVSDVESTTKGIAVDLGDAGSNVFDVYVDAYLEDNEIIPAIKWRYPGYAANYTIELTKEDGSVQLITSERVGSGVAPLAMLPEVSVNEDFSVRVRTESYGWSEPCVYKAGTIQEADRAFFARLEDKNSNGYGLGMNGYIVNMKEMGDLLNYISLYRPAALLQTDEDAQPNTYVVRYKTAFRYTDLDKEKYPCNQNPSTDNEELKDVFRIMNAAFNAYAETGAFRASYALENGGVRLTMTFNDELYTELKRTNQTGISEGTTKAHYSTRGSERLPIEREMRSQITVFTGDQLLYALTHGLYPVCEQGSAAERIWKKARAVSLRIIDDGMTDADKIHAIYDYLTLEVIYDYALLSMANGGNSVTDYAGFYLDGVFDDGVAVCDGISKAFILLARMQGIAAEKVAGRAGSGSSEVGHAWNRVFVDGQWYVCDATWGNRRIGTSLEMQTHGFLLVADSVIDVDHKGYGEFPAAPESMDIYFGVDHGGYDAVIDSEEEMKRGVRAVLFSLLEDAEDGYWEVTLSDEMIATLRTLYPNLAEHNALSFMFAEFIRENGYDGKVYSATNGKYYLWAERKEAA